MTDTERSSTLFCEEQRTSWPFVVRQRALFGMLSADLVEEFNQFRKTAEGAPICTAPLFNMHFSQLGVITACCFNRKHVLGAYPDQSLREIWEGDRTRELRELLAKNDMSHGCDKCEQQILARDFGGSHAAFYSIYQQQLVERGRSLGMVPPDPSDPQPTKLEFNIHNACNLQCMMCHGLASSLVRTRREGLGALPNPYDACFVDQLEPFLPRVVQTDFLGGEPFLLAAYRQIWERIAQVSPKTRVAITTNGTVLDNEVKALLERMDVTIHVSIDSHVRETYETIRVGASYDDVMAHSEYFRELMESRGERLQWRYCPMRINWREMPDTLRYCNGKGIFLHFNQLDFPINQSLATLPRDELARVVAHLDENGPGEPTNEVERSNQINWIQLVMRLRAFLEPGNRRDALVARLGLASAVVDQYSLAREGKFQRRVTVSEAQSDVTEAAKVLVAARLNVDQALEDDLDLPAQVHERLRAYTAQLLGFIDRVPARTVVREFLDEIVRAWSWGLVETHDDGTFARIAEFSQCLDAQSDPAASVAAVVATAPAELYRLFGLSSSLAEARRRFGVGPGDA